MQWDPRSSTSDCEVFVRRHIDVSMKTCATLFENLLTVLCTDAAISTGRDPRVPEGLEGISGIHVQLVSPNFKSVSKFVLLPEVLSVSCV